jgi:hypothetical protein
MELDSRVSWNGMASCESIIGCIDFEFKVGLF